MARRHEDRRWNSKFARFAREYGVAQLALRLGVKPSAIYHWIAGHNRPHIANAMMIRDLARERGARLSLDDVYGRPRSAQS